MSKNADPKRKNAKSASVEVGRQSWVAEVLEQARDLPGQHAACRQFCFRHGFLREELDGGGLEAVGSRKFRSAGRFADEEHLVDVERVRRQMGMARPVVDAGEFPYPDFQSGFFPNLPRHAFARALVDVGPAA